MERPLAVQRQRPSRIRSEPREVQHAAFRAGLPGGLERFVPEEAAADQDGEEQPELQDASEFRTAQSP